MSRLSRRAVLVGSAALTAVGSARAGSRVLRIGYQRYGNLLLLKSSGLVEQRLKAIGRDVEWKMFMSGPPLMEALNAGAIDFGSVGETPPIFGQVANGSLLYLGAEPPSPTGEAILVLKDSPIKTLADLKGKRIALNKGSNVHYLFVKALESVGLSPSDVTPVYLAPADGRAAFERGSVEAWVIWDPFLAAAQAAGKTRVLTDGTKLVSNHQFYVGSRRFTDKPALEAVLGAIATIDARTSGDPGAAAEMLSAEVGLPVEVVATALKRQSWAITPMDAKLIAEQQRIADTFFKLGLIPRAIKVADAVEI